MSKSSSQYVHGAYHTKEHNVWMAMNQRCNNPKDKDFENYGARGIKVAKELKLFGFIKEN